MKFPRVRLLGEIERLKGHIRDMLGCQREVAGRFQKETLTTTERECIQGGILEHKELQEDSESKFLEVANCVNWMQQDG